MSAEATPPRPAPSKAQLQPPPPPPPQQQARLDSEDAQSVLARLRQLSPSAPPSPAQQPEAPPSPSLPRLLAARSALAAGQIDEARRLMQQAQLQLVFRPVDTQAGNPDTAGKGASDVARALEALSANDISRSRRYVEIAIDDVAGTGAKAPPKVPVQESGMRSTGYAPAYPSR